MYFQQFRKVRETDYVSVVDRSRKKRSYVRSVSRKAKLYKRVPARMFVHRENILNGISTDTRKIFANDARHGSRKARIAVVAWRERKGKTYCIMSRIVPRR